MLTVRDSFNKFQNDIKNIKNKLKTWEQIKKTIVITGGAGGIGTACAKAFKDEKIILTDYSQKMVDAAVEELSKAGYDVSGIVCDITDKKDVEKLSQFVKEKGD